MVIKETKLYATQNQIHQLDHLVRKLSLSKDHLVIKVTKVKLDRKEILVLMVNLEEVARLAKSVIKAIKVRKDRWEVVAKKECLDCQV